MPDSPAPDLANVPAAPASAAAPGAPFTVRAVLADGVRVWGRDGLPLFLAAVAFSAPSLALRVSSALGDPTSGVLRAMGESLAGIVLGVAEAAALTSGALASWRGERPRVGALVLDGIRLLPRAFVTAAWGAVACLGAIALTSLVSIRTRLPPELIDQTDVVLGSTAAGAGAVLLAAGALYVALPAAVAERERSAFAALARSVALTRGRRLQVSALGLLTMATLTAVALAPLFRRMTPVDSMGLLVAVALVSVVPSGACVTTAAAAYRALRTEKEGASALELSDVFD